MGSSGRVRGGGDEGRDGGFRLEEKEIVELLSTAVASKSAKGSRAIKIAKFVGKRKKRRKGEL